MTARRWLALAVAVVCSAAWYRLMPPQPRAVTTGQTGGAAPVRGAIHVHTRRSDGTGTVDSVAAASARAGLQFVILTDHGDGTREAEPPSYRRGVLCIEAVEIGTDGGHVVALGLPPSPYPLGGEAGEVIEDIRRMGGLSIAAHPDSARADLRWADWGEGFDGLEWLNGDSEWRDERWPDLARALLTYPFRPAATLARLLDRPQETLNRWDELTQHRQVVALAASDAHARLDLDPSRNSAALRVPSYEQVFRTFSIALPDVRLTGAAAEDARVVIDAIRRGAVYSAIDGLATPAVLTFSAISGSNRVTTGDTMPLDGPPELRVEANAPADAQIVLFKDGLVVASSAPPALVYSAPLAPAVYRTEVHLAGAPGVEPVPWVMSNPIYIGRGSGSVSLPRVHTRATESVPIYVDGPVGEWRIEKNAGSGGTIGVVPTVGGAQLTLRYGLGGTISEGPYVAAAVPSESGLARFDRLTFTARAARPMRMSVQLRAPSDAQDRRWRRSVYLGEAARTVTVFFDALTPAGPAAGPLVLAEIRTVLFVVDSTNTKPGSSGQVWLDDVQVAR